MEHKRLSSSFKITEITKTSVFTNRGPRYSGRLNYRSIDTGPSHRFPSTERFEEKDFLKIAASVIRGRSNSREFIKQNIEKARYLRQSDEYHLKKIHKRMRCCISKDVKKNILERKIAVFKHKIQEKDRKFGMRMRTTELILLKKSWIPLFVISGFLLICHCKIKHKLYLQEQSERHLTWFKNLSIFIGKNKRILLEIRKKRSMRMIRIYLTSYIHQWTQNYKLKCSQLVTETIEECLTSGFLFNVMVRWKFKILHISRMIRRFIQTRRFYYSSALKKWKQIEIKNLKQRVLKKGKKGLARKSTIFVPVLSDEAKLQVLKMFLKEKLRQSMENSSQLNRDNQNGGEPDEFELRDLLKEKTILEIIQFAQTHK